MKWTDSILMLLLATLMSCCNRPLDRDAYVSWLKNEKNGLRDIRSEGGRYFDLQYQPAEMVYLQRNPGNSLGREETEAELEGISVLQYYTLTVGLERGGEDFIASGTSGPAERQERIYYFSYPFQEDIFLVENGKKLSPVLFHFERSMDMKSSRTFVLGFENTGAGRGTATFVIESPLFGPAPIELKINKTDLKKLKL
jgi:hypothetical protein